MRGANLIEMLGGIDNELIAEAENIKKERQSKRRLKRAALLSFAAALIFCGIFIGKNPWVLYKIKSEFTAHEHSKYYIVFNEDSLRFQKLIDEAGCSVVLGDYSGVRYGLYRYELTDEQVEAVAMRRLSGAGRYAEVTDRPAEDTDLIEAELYVALSDGREFTFNKPHTETTYPDGNSVASPSNYVIFVAGGESFTAGALEDAAIGQGIGERVEVDLTISGDDINIYNFLRLCGLEGEFAEGALEGVGAEVSAVIKKISARIDVEYDEEFFAAYYAERGFIGPGNLKDYIAYTREQMTASYERNLADDNRESMMRAIFEVCKFEIPNGAIPEDENSGTSEDSEYRLKYQLAIEAIAVSEGIAVSDAEYRALLKEIYYNIPEKFRRQVPTINTIKREYGEENIRWCILQEKVLDYLRAELIPYDAGMLDYIDYFMK